MLQICQNIKQARLSAKLSQEELAEKMGIKRTTYQNYEKNIVPDLDTLKDIANNLGIPAYQLLKGVIDFTEKERSDLKSDLDKDRVEEIRVSLTQLASAVGRLVGLSEQQAFDLLLPSDSTDEPGFEDMRKHRKRKTGSSQK